MEYSIVFGASGGIGKEFCTYLASRGDNLIISGRSENKLELLKNLIYKINDKISVLTLPINLQDENNRQTAFNYLKEQNVKIKGLYFVAGIDTRKPFENYTQEKISTQVRVNFESAVDVARFCLENRAENLDMLIVSSACGFTPMPYYSLYSATKCGLIYFFKGLKSELKGKKVKITILCPGSVPTRKDIVEDIKLQGLTGKFSKKSPEYVVKKAMKALDKNKTICIPGTYNKILNFLSKLTPYKVQSAIIKRKFKDIPKDAF